MKKSGGAYFVLIPGLALGAVLALDTVLAYAEPEEHQGQMHGQMEEQMFKEVDTNGDGAISKAEFNAFQAKQFKSMDANGDGKISHDEMEAGHQKQADGGTTTHLDKRFQAADADHDGGLDREEAKAMPMLSMYFDEVDSNKDDKVTRQEYFDAMPLLHRAKQDKANSL